MDYRRSLFLVFAAAVVLGGGSARTVTQSDSARGAPRVTAVRVGRLFDGKSTTVLTNQVILIEDGRITAVGGALTLRDGALYERRDTPSR